jgi:succinoglycan biosynthesis transport protein ExoP
MKERASFSVAAVHNRSSDISLPAVDLSLDELLRKLRRRKWLIFVFVALATLLTAVGSLLLTSRYTATAEVLVADHPAAGLDFAAAMQGMPPDVAHMSSQVQVITSRNLASSVIDKLGLELDPEFNAALKPRSVIRRLIDELPIDDVKRKLGLAPPALNETAAKQLQRDAVVDAFLEDVSAETVETSRVIQIGFASEDPAKAALIANTLADAYINQQLQTQYEAIRRTMSWLTDRVDALRKEVKDADQAVEKFRTESGLLQGARGERLSDQQISELSSQLMLARSRRAESEARLSQMRSLARSDAMASLAEVVNSPLISTLITQETEVKRKIAQLSEEYGSRHPVLINAKAELQDLRAKIDLEVKRIVQSLQNEISVASAREQSLQRSLDQFGSRLSKSNSDEVTLRALERDADAARSTLETFLQQAHQLNAQDTLRAQQPDVTLISYAPVPSEPSFPKRKLLVALAVVVSGLIAIVLVLVIEQLDVGFRSSEQLEQAFGIPVLGSIPDMGRRRHSNKRVARYVLEQPTSSFAEAIRRAHTKLLHEPTIRTVQLTSAEPGEGKTTLALNLAQTDARLGRRVLLVDADFRRSEVADILELRKSPGLIDVLTERARFEHAVQTDKSGADVLVAGGFQPSASEMLVLRNLAPLLSPLREQYDLIIFDTPPVISLVDAAVVAGFVDRTILVVRWAGTRRSVVSHALNEIVAAGGTLGGVILSMVNVKEHALYSFGDSGQYAGRYKKYYDVA